MLCDVQTRDGSCGGARCTIVMARMLHAEADTAQAAHFEDELATQMGESAAVGMSNRHQNRMARPKRSAGSVNVERGRVARATKADAT